LFEFIFKVIVIQDYIPFLGLLNQKLFI